MPRVTLKTNGCYYGDIPAFQIPDGGLSVAKNCYRRNGRWYPWPTVSTASSLLLCVREEKVKPVEAAAAPAWEDVPAEGVLAVEPLAPNVLTLDYCDLVVRDRTEKDLYFYDAQRKTFQAYGLDRNPWDSAVQYKTNILDKDKFPAESGFEAVFWFRAVKEDARDFDGLKAVVERPELFRVFVNAREVKAIPGAWWLDRAFGVFPGGGHVVSGRNKITVKARPFTIHSELEPVYLLGEFRLAEVSRGFEIHPPEPFAPGSWKPATSSAPAMTAGSTRAPGRSSPDRRRRRCRPSRCRSRATRSTW